MLLSIGIVSGRSKFYGFYAVAWFVILFASRMREFKLNAKNISIILLMFCAVVFVAREKINFYFDEARKYLAAVRLDDAKKKELADYTAWMMKRNK